MPRSRILFGLIIAGSLLVVCGCATAEIRVENVSSHDFTDLSIAGEPYGDVPAGATTDYRKVKRKLGYVAMKLWVDGRYVTGQTLTMGSNPFTYRIGVKNLAKRHLTIEIVRDRRASAAPGEGPGDGGHVAHVGAAAAAPDVDPGHAAAELEVLGGELRRVAVVERLSTFELLVAQPRGVAADAPDAPRPGRVVEQMEEVIGMRAVDHEVLGGPRSGGVDLLDRLAQRLAAR